MLYLTFGYGTLPWIALTLAASFGLYVLVKKVAPLSSSPGLTLETSILFLPALAFLIYPELEGRGAFLHVNATTNLLILGAGLVTTVPLLLFSSATQMIPLTTLGVLQYIEPTLQFILGVLVYREPFSPTRLLGFTIVWVALIMFSVEGLYARRKQGRLVEIEDVES